jgi:hypothetical protein
MYIIMYIIVQGVQLLGQSLFSVLVANDFPELNQSTLHKLQHNCCYDFSVKLTQIINSSNIQNGKS